jgi:hypothetical protein
MSTPPTPRPSGIGLLTLLLAAGVALGMPKHAHAYLDPASGSILLQVVLGGIAGAGLLVKLYWHRLLRLVGLRRSDGDGRRDP